MYIHHLICITNEKTKFFDPGTNSLLTMLSKDGKTHYTYSKCKYISRTKRRETLDKIERIKKEKINYISKKELPENLLG